MDITEKLKTLEIGDKAITRYGEVVSLTSKDESSIPYRFKRWHRADGSVLLHGFSESAIVDIVTKEEPKSKPLEDKDLIIHNLKTKNEKLKDIIIRMTERDLNGDH